MMAGIGRELTRLRGADVNSSAHMTGSLTADVWPARLQHGRLCLADAYKNSETQGMHGVAACLPHRSKLGSFLLVKLMLERTTSYFLASRKWREVRPTDRLAQRSPTRSFLNHQHSCPSCRTTSRFTPSPYTPNHAPTLAAHLENLVQLHTALHQPAPIGTINDIDQRIRLVKVVAPAGVDRVPQRMLPCAHRRKSRLKDAKRRACHYISVFQSPTWCCVYKASARWLINILSISCKRGFKEVWLCYPLHARTHQYGLMDRCPPMSQMLRLNPSRFNDLMLKPWKNGTEMAARPGGGTACQHSMVFLHQQNPTAICHKELVKGSRWAPLAAVSVVSGAGKLEITRGDSKHLAAGLCIR